MLPPLEAEPTSLVHKLSASTCHVKKKTVGVEVAIKSNRERTLPPPDAELTTLTCELTTVLYDSMHKPLE